MRTRTKLLWLGGAGITLLLLIYLVEEHADMLAAASVILFIVVVLAFATIVLLSAFRWGRRAAEQWRTRTVAVLRPSKTAIPSTGDEEAKKLDQMVKDVPKPKTTGKSEADALLDQFIRDS